MWKDFLYTLTDKEGKSYYFLLDFLRRSGVPKPLAVGPAGWQDTLVEFGRNSRAHGLFRSYTPPLEFVKEGARIIRHMMYTQGPEGDLWLRIYMLDKSFGGGLIHRRFYAGEIDLSNTIDNPDSVQANIMEGGLQKYVKANENTSYEIPMNHDKAVIVRHDGIILKKTAKYVAVDGVGIDRSMYGGLHATYVYFINQDGEAQGVEYKSQSAEMAQDSGPDVTNWINYVKQSENWIVHNTNVGTIEVTIKGKLLVNVDRSGGMVFRFQTSTQTTANQDAYNFFSGGLTAGTVNEIPVDATITLQPGEKLYLFANWSGSGVQVYSFAPNSDLQLSTFTRGQATNVLAFTPIDFFQILLDKMTEGSGQQYKVVSPYLEQNNGLLVTCGDALRRFSNAVAKTSFSDAFDSYNVPLNLAYDVQGYTLRIYPKKEAYGQDVIADLGITDNPSIGFAQEYLFNTIKIGYPDAEAKDVNSRSEFNMTHTYGTAITKVVKELSLVSKYSSSIYDIEYARLNFDGKESTSGDTDSTLFFLHCHDSPVLNSSGLYYQYILKRNATVTGIPYPESVYNAEITPKRCLLKHGSFIRSCLWFNQNSLVKFQSADKMVELTTTIMGVTVTERNNEQVTDLENSYFMPISIEAESTMPTGMIEQMQKYPNQSIQMTIHGQQIIGYPLKLSVNPATKPAQKTTILLRADNKIVNMER